MACFITHIWIGRISSNLKKKDVFVSGGNLRLGEISCYKIMACFVYS